MSNRVKRLTPSMLRKMVIAERRRLQRESSDPIASGVVDPEKVSAEEVEAGEEATALEKDIDFIKALKIQQQKLKKKLKKVQEAKRRVGVRIMKKA